MIARMLNLIVKSPSKLFSIVLAIGLLGCDSNSSDSGWFGDPIFGPCVVIEREPVLNIIDAIDSSNNQSIQQVQISNIRIDGSLIDFRENHLELSSNIEFDYVNDILTCTLPCGIGQQEGTWEFTVTASGYQDSEETIETSYALFDGGCPAYLDQGTEVSLQLEPTS